MAVTSLSATRHADRPTLMNRNASVSLDTFHSKSVSRHFPFQPANQQQAPQQQQQQQQQQQASSSSRSNSNRINMSSDDDDVPSQDLQAGDDEDRALQRREAAASPHQGDRQHNGYAGAGVLGDAGVATPHHSQPDPLSQGGAEELARVEAGRVSSPDDNDRARRRLARAL